MGVIQLRPNADIPAGLRNIADGMENGDFHGDGCTVIIGLDVFHLGCVNDDEAAGDAIFNMTFGIQKLMQPLMSLSAND